MLAPSVGMLGNLAGAHLSIVNSIEVTVPTLQTSFCLPTGSTRTLVGRYMWDDMTGT